MCVSRNNEARSYNHCCSVKAISITFTEYVFVSIVTQHAQHMRLIRLSSVSQAVSYFATVCHKEHGVRKNVLEQKICFDFLYKFV